MKTWQGLWRPEVLKTKENSKIGLKDSTAFTNPKGKEEDTLENVEMLRGVENQAEDMTFLSSKSASIMLMGCSSFPLSSVRIPRG